MIEKRNFRKAKPSVHTEQASEGDNRLSQRSGEQGSGQQIVHAIYSVPAAGHINVVNSDFLLSVNAEYQVDVYSR